MTAPRHSFPPVLSARWRDAARALLLPACLFACLPAAGARERPVQTAKVPVAAEAVLPLPVLRALRQAGIGTEQVAVMVLPLDGQAPLLAHRPDVPMNPASAMKLVTTYAALGLLGPDYRWRTDWVSTGSVDDGVLRGDLVLRGGGDPKLVAEDLAALVERLRATGLHTIAGDLLVDDSLYAVARDETAFDGDPSQPYNVWPNAAMLNFKASRFVVAPPADGERGVSILTDPPLDVAIDNAVEAVPGPCRHGVNALAIREGQAPAEAGSRPVLRVSGRWSPACGEQSTFAAVLDHRRFIGAMFRAAWTAVGGQWTGQARWRDDARPADGASLRPLVEWVSPRTLADVVRDINKHSNNVMARQVFLQAAADVLKLPATPERARRVVDGWLRNAGLSLPGLSLDNGSGLSRTERVSAAGLADLLRHAAAGPFADAMRESLPVVGVDGTMKRRLVDEPVAGRAWLKSGSLSDVRAVAGYVDTASGRRVALVMLVNGNRAEAASPAIDAMIRWTHNAW